MKNQRKKASRSSFLSSLHHCFSLSFFPFWRFHPPFKRSTLSEKREKSSAGRVSRAGRGPGRTPERFVEPDRLSSRRASFVDGKLSLSLKKKVFSASLEFPSVLLTQGA